MSGSAGAWTTAMAVALSCAALSCAALCGVAGAQAQPIAAQPLPPPAGSRAAPGTPPGTPPASASGNPAGTPPGTHRRRKPHVPVLAAPPGVPRRAAAAKPAVRAAPKSSAKEAAPSRPAPVAAIAPARVPADPTKGTSTGLKLPRWVSFRSDEVNLRSGPGMQYPIQWVYHRRDYPVQILREFDVWRLVQDQDGTKGWVHQATLTGRRGFVVIAGPQILRAAAADSADAVAELMAGVVGQVRKCPAGSEWCEVQAGSYRGWLKRAATYGISSDEVIG